MQTKTNGRSFPNGWQWVRLGDVAEYINGMAFKPIDWKTSGLPIIRQQNLTSSDSHFNHYQGEFDEKYLVENGDLLISWSASLNAYIWQQGKADNINALFIAQQMQTSNIRKQIEAVAKRAIGQSSINSTDIKGLKVKNAFDVGQVAKSYFTPLI